MRKTLVLALLLLLSLNQTFAAPQAARQVENFNSGWKFNILDNYYSYFDWYEDDDWQNVIIPHIPKIEAYDQDDQWQGTCWYRKWFTLPQGCEDKKIFIKFEGAMHIATVWVNNTPIITHEGGYLPFTVDITDLVHPTKPNLIALRINNDNNPEIPPGKKVSSLDFFYYGGLYREANLIITDKVHITDAVHAGKAASGGIFVTTPLVTKELAKVNVKTHVANDSDKSVDCKIRTTILDPDNKPIITNISDPVTIKALENHSIEQAINVKNLSLWSPWSPALYNVKTEVLTGNEVRDSVTTRFGIRTINFNRENGFQINGKRFYLRGVNRHEQYPYIGNRLSRNAQYRDARKIKEAGFDYIRLSHYPQSPDFMNACDELGLVVMDCIPGWQFMGKQKFKELCYQNSRDLIRRDRNHPCVVLWEVSLNESWMKKDYIVTTHNIAHEEYPGDDCFTCGWAGKEYDVFLQARQHRLKHGGHVKTEKPYVISEYGDWEFYALEKGQRFKGFRDPNLTSRQLRIVGEKRLLQQAKNFQEALSDNRTNTPALGDGLWVMFDYNRGTDKGHESSGVMDIFRLPKFSYYFYQSQRPADEKIAGADSGPMANIASYWDEKSPTDVMVYSNCDEVALYLNDKLLAKQKPDNGEHTSNLWSPPFTFSLGQFTPGTLKAVGYIKGKEAATHIVQTPLEPTGLVIKADLMGIDLAADGVDTIFVYANVVDKNGTTVWGSDTEITFSVSGPAKLVGDNPTNAQAGIATVLLQASDKPGNITVKAKAKGLPEAKLTLSSK